MKNTSYLLQRILKLKHPKNFEYTGKYFIYLFFIISKLY